MAAVGVAVAMHAFFWGWARQREPSLEEWSAAIAARIHAELAQREVVELQAPTAKQPPPPTKEPVAPVARPDERVAPVVRRKRVAPVQAQAGRIVAQPPRADAPVDLTGNTFVTGSAKAYAGGSTAARGTSAVAVAGGEGDANGRTAPNLSRAVSLGDDEWRCAWPAEADAQQIYEQAVVIRVRVRVDGSAAAVRLVSDPGHGFGRAAVACAMATHFLAARDRAGRAIEAESPAIRVRFTR